MFLTIKLAYRNIFRQRRRSLLTGLSMCGGYMLFVFSTSLLEGSWNNILNIFLLDHVSHIQIHKDDYADKPRIYKTINERAPLEDTLAGEKDVVSFAPRIYSSSLAYAGDKTYPARVIGIDPVMEPTVSRIADKVSEGQFFSAAPDSDGYYSTMIGRGLASSLDIGIGDELVLISQGADGSIANDIYLVSAIIGNRTSFDRMAVYLPLGTAQQFLALGDNVHEYGVLVKDLPDNEQVATRLQQMLPSVTVSPWQVVERTFYVTMQSDKQGNHFMMGIIVFIVFIGVLNTVLMSVLERTREFGVLRAIGCRPGKLVILVLLETLMLAAMSMAVGAGLILPVVIWVTEVGFLIPEPVDMGGIEFQHMKGELTAYVFLMPMAFIFATAAVISLFPGIRAANILPRDALGSH